MRAGRLAAGVGALAAIILAMVSAGGATRAESSPALSPDALRAVCVKSVAEMESLARSNPLEFLRTSLRWHEQRITDYTCTFQRQELVNGKLGKTEIVALKFREEPLAVYMKWRNGPNKGQEVIYAQGRNDGKLVVHPGGLTGAIFRKVFIEPDGKLAMKQSRRPITQAGMAHQLEVVIPEIETGFARGDCCLEYIGIRDECGRPAYVFKRTFPKKDGYTCHQLFIYIDQQFLVTVRTEAYDWEGRLVSDYRYTDLQINPGLTDDDFDPNNRDYAYRVL